jgi:hypothetical protein
MNNFLTAETVTVDAATLERAKDWYATFTNGQCGNIPDDFEIVAIFDMVRKTSK